MEDLNEPVDDRAGVEDRSLAEVLREGIAAKGVNLVRLRDQLAELGNPVSLATLSYWRSGQRHPEGTTSHAAVEALEGLLGLRPGDLTDRLHSSAEPIYEDEVLDQRYAETTAVLASLGIHRRDQVVIRTLHSTIDVDRCGHQRRLHYRMLLQARSDGVSDFGLVVGGNGDVAGGIRVSECHGAEVTGSRMSDDGSRFATAITFDQPLAGGERTILDVWFEMDPGFATDTRHTIGSLSPFREVGVWTRFDPERLPISLEEFTVAGGSETVHRRTLNGVSHYLQRRDFGPGVIGVRWDW